MSTFPFSAVVGQDDLKLSLLLNAVDPAVGGVLVRGQKGTAKSTTVRAVAALLPDLDVVDGDPYGRGPDETVDDPQVPPLPTAAPVTRPTPLVELPVGASEDRLVGALDLERALTEGVRAFEPGLLAAAHRGVLYVDEVNLLTDHLVDVLLDVAASGVNQVERDGVSVRHPSRFLLVGTMNPEEGELRPQLLDRFGLSVTVAAPTDGRSRAQVVRRRMAHDADPAGFARMWWPADADLAARIVAARDRLPQVVLSDRLLARIAHVCARFEVDGLRADLVIARAARAHAAWSGRDQVVLTDVRAAALLALPHRRRRGPLEEPGIDPDELERVLQEPLDDDPDDDPAGGSDDDGPDPGRDESGTSDGGQDGEEGGEDGRDRDAPRAPGGPPSPPAEGENPRPARGATDFTAGSADPDPADGGTPEDRADEAHAPPTGDVHAVGTAGRPPLLVAPGRGGGGRGRRSATLGTAHGRVVTDRPLQPGEPVHDVAVGASLRSAAVRHRPGTPMRLRRDDLRTRVRQGREGNLIVFVVDASASMGARRRMTAVKGAIRALLLDAYQRRDQLALITFGGHDAELVLPPTGSVDVADRQLARLAVGGRTPLAAGLARAGELAATAGGPSALRPLLVVLTDGRANAGGPDPVAAAHRQAEALAARELPAVVVDTEDGYVRLGMAEPLGAALRAPVLQLDDLGASALTQVVRTAVGRRAR